MIHDSSPDTDTPDNTRVGCLGWQSSQLPDFYPGDLPPEWQAEYYANEFRALAITPAMLAGIEPDGWQDWPDNFTLYLLQQQALTEVQQSQLQQYPPPLSGVLTDDHVIAAAGLPVYRLTDASQSCHVYTRTDGQQHVVTLSIDGRPLRQLRDELDKLKNLPGNLESILVSDPVIPMKQLKEFHTLVEIMGF